MRLHLCLAAVLAAVLVASLHGGPVHASSANDMRVPEDVRSISYFPALGGWTLMWTRFDAEAIDRDLARIAWLRANTVRVIVPARVFGYPQPEAAMSARLENVVDLAARHGLRVELTLFDWWHDYADVAGSRRWAGAVLSPYAGDPRIAFVELQNEIRPQDAGAAEWAAALIPYVRDVSRLPVAISVPALDPARDLRLLHAALGSAQPDFYSAHFYWRPELAAHYLERARDAVAPLPLRLGETGYSTAIPYEVLPGLPASPSAREAEQGYYLRSLALVARRVGLSPIAPWILSDFAPEAIPADDPAVHGNAREYRFGLFRVSGAAKPAAAELRRSSPAATWMASTAASRTLCATKPGARCPRCGGSAGRRTQGSHATRGSRGRVVPRVGSTAWSRGQGLMPPSRSPRLIRPFTRGIDPR